MEWDLRLIQALPGSVDDKFVDGELDELRNEIRTLIERRWESGLPAEESARYEALVSRELELLRGCRRPVSSEPMAKAGAPA